MEKKLKELQAQWYQRLKDEGFNDIEDTNSPREMLKTWDSSYFQIKYTPETFGMREEYYLMATSFLSTHKFQSEVEKEIWRLHTDGKSVRLTVAELKKIGIVTYKDAVNKTIQRLASLMKNQPRMEDGQGFIKRVGIKRRRKE